MRQRIGADGYGENQGIKKGELLICFTCRFSLAVELFKVPLKSEAVFLSFCTCPLVDIMDTSSLQ